MFWNKYPRVRYFWCLEINYYYIHTQFSLILSCECIFNTRTHQQQIINVLAILITSGFNLLVTRSYHQLYSLLTNGRRLFKKF
jgi:hypothetical protein